MLQVIKSSIYLKISLLLELIIFGTFLFFGLAEFFSPSKDPLGMLAIGLILWGLLLVSFFGSLIYILVGKVEARYKYIPLLGNSLIFGLIYLMGVLN